VQVKYITCIKYIKSPTNAGKINILKFITFLVLDKHSHYHHSIRSAKH